MAKRKLVRGRWSSDEIKLLKKLFPNASTREVAGQLGRSAKSAEQKASKIGLKKSRKHLKSIGRA
jgi:hypothetical protein